MTGFGLYETLRLFIPGAIAAALIDVIIRLTMLSADSPAAEAGRAAVQTLEGGTFLLVALALGFILYALDLPVRSRLYVGGDPAHNVPVPSKRVQQILRSSEHLAARGRADKALSLYLLLMDAHFPKERHKAVYLFGGLYRIYFDARVLAATAIAIGPAMGLVISQAHSRGASIESAYVLPVVIILFFLALSGAIAELRHASASIRGRGESHALDHEKRYPARLQRAVVDVLPVAGVILTLQFAGVILATVPDRGVSLTGLGLCIGSITLWVMFEMGPPQQGTEDSYNPSDTVRSAVLEWLRCPTSADTQFIPAARLLVDIALFFPALLAAAILTVDQGRASWVVLIWGLMPVVATLIMSIRKHEERLITSFRDQTLWVDLNEDKIQRVAAGEADSDSWV